MRVQLKHLIFVVFVSCTLSATEMSEPEKALIESVIIGKDESRKAEALNIINQRIELYGERNDYMIKVQILLDDKQFQEILILLDVVIEKYPDYVEMIALHAGVSLYLQDPDSKKYYHSALNGYELRLQKSNTDDEKYMQIINMLLLSCLFSDEINKVKYSEMSKEFGIFQGIGAEDILGMTESEIFEAFGISSAVPCPADSR